MNYIKPEDIKAYVEQNPTGIAGMSEELSVMVNHFAELIVRECIRLNGKELAMSANYRMLTVYHEHFGVEE